jgi:hypothetical protein
MLYSRIENASKRIEPNFHGSARYEGIGEPFLLF